MRPIRLGPRSLHCSLSSSELPSSTWARQANILIKGRRKTAVQHCVSRYTGQQSWGPRTSTPPTLCPFWACTRRILIIQKTNKWHIACWCSLFCEYHKLSFLRLLSGRWKINPKMQDDSKWSGGFGRREGGVDWGGGVFYGVCAMPRLDFIFSSLLERWLLFDSSSSTLSSADRNYRVKRGERTFGIKREPVEWMGKCAKLS